MMLTPKDAAIYSLLIEAPKTFPRYLLAKIENAEFRRKCTAILDVAQGYKPVSIADKAAYAEAREILKQARLEQKARRARSREMAKKRKIVAQIRALAERLGKKNDVYVLIPEINVGGLTFGDGVSRSFRD